MGGGELVPEEQLGLDEAERSQLLLENEAPSSNSSVVEQARARLASYV